MNAVCHWRLAGSSTADSACCFYSTYNTGVMVGNTIQCTVPSRTSTVNGNPGPAEGGAVYVAVSVWADGSSTGANHGLCMSHYGSDVHNYGTFTYATSSPTRSPTRPPVRSPAPTVAPTTRRLVLLTTTSRPLVINNNDINPVTNQPGGGSESDASTNGGSDSASTTTVAASAAAVVILLIVIVAAVLVVRRKNRRASRGDTPKSPDRDIEKASTAGSTHQWRADPRVGDQDSGFETVPRGPHQQPGDYAVPTASGVGAADGYLTLPSDSHRRTATNASYATATASAPYHGATAMHAHDYATADAGGPAAQPMYEVPMYDMPSDSLAISDARYEAASPHASDYAVPSPRPPAMGPRIDAVRL